MTLNYKLSSQDFTITDGITTAVEALVSKLNSHHSVQRTDIGCRKMPDGFHVSITAKAEHDDAVHCEVSAKDLYTAFSMSKAKLIRQLKDQKEKKQDFHRITVQEALVASPD
jgi:ribosomal subunit interface protein